MEIKKVDLCLFHHRQGSGSNQSPQAQKTQCHHLGQRTKTPAGLGKSKILLGEVDSNSAVLQMGQKGQE